MKQTLIFSDVHLKVTEAARPARERFLAFLRGIEPAQCGRLICLGDLFDFWFEYRHVCFSGYFDILRAFADLRDAGVELHLVCGNHDFWAGRFLRESVGFTIHPDGTAMDFGGKKALLLHGDGINKEDRAYRCYKRIARNPLVVGAFRLIHPDWAMAIAQGVSHGSRSLLQVENPAEGPEARAIREKARSIIAAGEADVVMCGHAHSPTLETHPGPNGTGIYINTGDWLRHRTFVVWDGERFEMKEAREG